MNSFKLLLMVGAVFILFGCSNARFDEETMVHSKTHTRFDQNGFDMFGYNASGYDRNNFDAHGINLVTKSLYDEEGYNKEGYDKDGYDREGYDEQGVDENGRYKVYRVKFLTEAYAEGLMGGKCRYKNLKVDGETMKFKKYMELKGAKHRIEYTLYHQNDWGTHINESDVVRTVDLSKYSSSVITVRLSSTDLEMDQIKNN